MPGGSDSGLPRGLGCSPEARFRQLAELSHALAGGELDLSAILDTVGRRISALYEGGCVIFLRGEDPEVLVLAAAHHVVVELARAVRIVTREEPLRVGAGLNGRVAQTGEPVVLAGVTEAQLLARVEPRHHDVVRRLEIDNLVVLPLEVRGVVLGTITLFATLGEAVFGPTEQEHLAAIAERAALAIANAQLVDRIRRREAEARLYTDLLRELEVGVIVWRVEEETCRLVSANPAAVSLLPGGAEPGLDLAVAAPELLEADHGTHLRAVLDRGSSEALPEIERLGRTWSVRAGPLGEGLVGVLTHDVTEQRALVERQRRFDAQLHHTQKLESLGVLAGGIAHDFNNLLVGVMGNASLAMLELSPTSSAREPLERVETTARRAAELTHQMLAYSGRGRFVIEAIDLSNLVKEMTHLLEVALSPKAVLRYELAEGLPLVEADAAQLRQIVMNLITNASDAVGEVSGYIIVRTGVLSADRPYLEDLELGEQLEPGTFVFLEVSDTGRGMDRATRDRIFDPFFTTKETGRGLGLAAALGIVRGHDGALKVYSEPGRGTTVKVLLPVAPAKLQPGTGQGAEGAEGAEIPPGLTVLVADDEPLIRRVARSALARGGAQVLVAPDGQEAVELFRDHATEIDVVVLDLTMPRLSGLEAFSRIRAIRSDVPILMTSGYSEQEATNHLAGKGLSGFIQKPWTAPEFLAKVAAVVSAAK